jgi:hypothetical protein
MIGMGMRLTISGGREAVIRLVVLAAAVGLGAGLLLTAVAGINAVNAQNDPLRVAGHGGEEPSAHGPPREARRRGSTGGLRLRGLGRRDDRDQPRAVVGAGHRRRIQRAIH